MNKQDKYLLSLLLEKKITTQRDLSKISGYSLGSVNKSISNLISNKYIDIKLTPTKKAKKEFSNKKPKNAIILAAGFGTRMVPINAETPKGLLEVKNEVLIERIIKQLHEVEIKNIYIVVGFMKEKFEYLIDKFGVQLIFNPSYYLKNNLHSLNCARDYLNNAYIIPCDIWCEENIFRKYEPYSWYMISDKKSFESNIKINRKQELVVIQKEAGNSMIGVSYLEQKEALIVKNKLLTLSNNFRYDNSCWEETLFDKNKLILSSKLTNQNNVIEINTYEQLRNLDKNSDQLENNSIKVICEALKVDKTKISNITVLKKGMTNRSFLFTVNNKKYIMRIPGEGTNMLINRKQEALVYKAIDGKKICDEIIYINPKNGYKITEFIENSRVCDPNNNNDLKKCMDFLKKFHNKRLKVSHKFDIFKQINFYESLWNNKESIYKDYKETKENIFKLKKYIDSIPKEFVLAHIDAVPDNFLFSNNNNKEEIRLIDWEYAGMQDPHVDIAMFCIYSLYSKKQVDNLISIYFEDKCDEETKIKVYCYIASCGLLWSNWCEYKRSLGIDFDEYALKQYRYAKEYYKIVENYLEGDKNA